MYEFEGERRRTGGIGPVSWRSFCIAVGLHLTLFLLFWGLAKLFLRTPDVVIPLDLTIVPPWAEQTDDPDPDPNPPPKEIEPQPEVKPPEPEPEPPKIEEKPVEAVEKIVEKPKEKPKEKTKEKPKPVNLREKAKLVKTPPRQEPPPDLRAKARKIEPPPNMKTVGKGTAHDKPLSEEEFMRKMMEGYRIGSRNQIANDEVSRCVSLIVLAIRREWDKESFNWNPGLRPLKVEIQFGNGGVVKGFRILQGSNDGEVDRTARSALTRLRSVPGLSASFLQQFSTLPVLMEPVQH